MGKSSVIRDKVVSLFFYFILSSSAFFCHLIFTYFFIHLFIFEFMISLQNFASNQRIKAYLKKTMRKLFSNIIFKSYMLEFSSNQVPWLLVLFRLIHDCYWHWMINFLCVGLKQCRIVFNLS